MRDFEREGAQERGVHKRRVLSGVIGVVTLATHDPYELLLNIVRDAGHNPPVALCLPHTPV